LLSDAQRDRITVVLVSPRNPLNIGAVARAMANFGFSHLTLVAPYEPHWREARSAIGAPDLLQNAKSTKCLAEAVKDCTFVLGTGTLTHRKPEQPVISLPALPDLARRELAGGGRIALVFGPEKRGLTRDDLSYCHRLVEIPTDLRQPSMNLGQAAAVCLYELATHAGSEGTSGRNTQSRPPAAVPSGNLDVLSELIEEVMIEAGYSPQIMRAANRHSVRLLLRRLNLNAADIRRMLGFLRRVLWRLRRRPPS
jgi:TrmH family RNA methyltransferase